MLIVQMDERLAADAPLAPADVDGFAQDVRALIQGRLGGDTFVHEYHRSLQERPEVVVAHGQVAALLNGPAAS
jgi:hypothetical protein